MPPLPLPTIPGPWGSEEGTSFGGLGRVPRTARPASPQPSSIVTLPNRLEGSGVAGSDLFPERPLPDRTNRLSGVQGLGSFHQVESSRAPYGNAKGRPEGTSCEKPNPRPFHRFPHAFPPHSPQAVGEDPSAASHGLGTALLLTWTRRGPLRRGSGNQGHNLPGRGSWRVIPRVSLRQRSLRGHP